VVENEDLVNLPNWLALEFRIADGDWFDPRAVEILSYRQELDLRRGLLLRTIRFEDGCGRRSTLTERRFISMADMHLGAIHMALTAENWSAGVTVRSGIDGRVVNAGAQLYRPFNNRHLEPLLSMTLGPDGVHLRVRTSQSHLHVAQAARTQAFRGVEQPGYIGQEFSVELDQGGTLVLEKLASLYTSRDHAIAESGLAARKAVARAGRFDAAMPSTSWCGSTCGADSTYTCSPRGPASRSMSRCCSA
jgi:trehalose/maltose hydrolase-like predicted phosphorylase